MSTPKVYTPIEVRNMTAAQFAAYTPHPNNAAEPIFITDTRRWAVATTGGKYVVGGSGGNIGEINVIDAANTTSAFTIGSDANLSAPIQLIYDNATAGTRTFTLPASTLNGVPLQDGDTITFWPRIESSPPYASAQSTRYVNVAPTNCEDAGSSFIYYGASPVTYVWRADTAKWRCLSVPAHGGSSAPCVTGSGAGASIAGTATGTGAKAFTSGGGGTATGSNANASGDSSTAEGSGAAASATGASAFGAGANAAAANSTAIGSSRRTRLAGETAIGLRYVSSKVSTDGRISFGVQTTNATQTVIGLDGTSSLGAVLVADSVLAFSGIIVARQEGGNRDSKVWRVEGAIKRDNANSTVLIGTPTVTQIAADAGASAWALAVVANDTNETLELKATGEASKTINWGGHLVIVQVGAVAIQ